MSILLIAPTRLDNGGGAIVVNSDGSLSLSPATGKAATVTAGQLLVPDGTAGAPGWAFGSESSTGLYRPSAGVLSQPAAQAFGLRAAEQEIADERFARGDLLVRQDVPRTDREPPGAHQLLDAQGTIGTSGEIIGDECGLPVKQEAREARVGVEPRQQVVEHPDQPGAERGTRQVPLPIPVGVGDQVEDVTIHQRLGGQSGRSGRPGG